MSSDETSKLDISPLTVIVSESLDPRTRRKLEAEQQADIKTYTELANYMQTQTDLEKIKNEVNKKDDDDTDPFKTPEATENNQPTNQPATGTQPQQPTQSPAPAESQPAQQQPEQSQPASNTDNTASNTAAPAPTDQQTKPAASAGEDEEDLSSAFESHGKRLPKDFMTRVLKNYLALESSEGEAAGELDHFKIFVYVDLSESAVGSNSLESVQTLRDPENTIVVINEDSSPDADTTLRARKVAESLSSRGVKVFYTLDEAINYLNDLYDTVSGRKKGEN